VLFRSAIKELSEALRLAPDDDGVRATSSSHKGSAGAGDEPACSYGTIVNQNVWGVVVRREEPPGFPTTRQ